LIRKNIQIKGTGLLAIQNGRSHDSFMHATTLRVPGVRNRMENKLGFVRQPLLFQSRNDRRKTVSYIFLE